MRRIELGARDGVPKKPDPQAALEIARELGCAPSQTLFVGDSGVDMRTGAFALSSYGVRAMGMGGALWDGTNIYFGTNNGILVSTNGGQSFAVASVLRDSPSSNVITSATGSNDAATRSPNRSRKFVDVMTNTRPRAMT